jgi:hypothetical protein
MNPILRVVGNNIGRTGLDPKSSGSPSPLPVGLEMPVSKTRPLNYSAGMLSSAVHPDHHLTAVGEAELGQDVMRILADASTRQVQTLVGRHGADLRQLLD